MIESFLVQLFRTTLEPRTAGLEAWTQPLCYAVLPPVAQRTQLIMASWKKHRAIHLTATKAQFSISVSLTLPKHVIFYACENGPRNGNKGEIFYPLLGYLSARKRWFIFQRKINWFSWWVCGQFHRVRARKRDRECVRVCGWLHGMERESVCVWDGERERVCERECVCEREREWVWERERVSGCVQERDR